MEQLTFETPKKKKPAPHEKAYWCELIAGVIERPLTRVLGFTSEWPLAWIKESYLLAKASKNPAKYWWWYRKQAKFKNVL